MTLKEQISKLQEDQKKIVELQTELNQKLEEYKNQMREWFGFADGDRLNILQLVELMDKLITKE